MTKTLWLSILVIILALGVGYWVWQNNGADDTPINEEELGYTDPATLKPGDPFGVFTVESTSQDENGDWQVQLKGEKVVRGRLFAINPFKQDPEGGETCFDLEEANDEPITPALSEYPNLSFCLSSTIKAKKFSEENIPEDKKTPA